MSESSREIQDSLWDESLPLPEATEQHHAEHLELGSLLSERTGASIDDDDGGEFGSREEESEKPSPTALKLDYWSVRRGGEVLQESDRIRTALGAPKCEHHWDKYKLDIESRDRLEKANNITADFYSAAFELEVEFAKNPADPRLAQYMKTLFESAEFQELHRETVHDDLASELATNSFAEQYVKYIETEDPTDEFKKEMKGLGSIGKAIGKAKEDVKDLRDAESALGMGGDGSDGVTRLKSAEIAAAFKRVRKSSQLRRICELAGRFRRFAAAQQRRKTLHGQDDVVGVTLGNDIARLLPQEAMLMDDPDLELDLLRRLLECQAMQRELNAVEPKARGPVVVIVDESGSMNGEPVATAKAMALALCWIAREQKRWCCLVGFSGGTEGNYLVIKPGENKQDKLMDWLDHFYSGGSDMDLPLPCLPKKWKKLGCPKGQTDIIAITDACLHVDGNLEKSFNAWKAEEKVKMITLVVSNHGSNPDNEVKKVSDQVYHFPTLNNFDEEGVAAALSI
jgi:uncharacterized protein with von Willebrand factor type A (vWA) domain